MPIIRNNRIYLKNSDDKESVSTLWENHVQELIEAHKLRKGLGSPCIMINDDSSIQQSVNDNDLFCLHIEADQCDENMNKIFDRDSCRKLMRCITGAKYIRLGCWEGESELINEAQGMNPTVTRTYTESGQIEYIIELNEELLTQILNDLVNESGDIKWFNIMLQKGQGEDSVLFSSSHSGEEYYIIGVDPKTIELCINAVEQDYFHAIISDYSVQSEDE